MTETPRVRTSDAERERVAEQLRAAVGEGRLTLEEGDERLANLYTTKYRDELGPLVADLPNPAGEQRRGRRGGWGPAGAGFGPQWAGAPAGAPTDEDNPAASAWQQPAGVPPHYHHPCGAGFRGPRLGLLIPLLLLAFLIMGIAHGHFFLFIPLALLVLLGTRAARYGRRMARRYRA